MSPEQSLSPAASVTRREFLSLKTPELVASGVIFVASLANAAVTSQHEQEIEDYVEGAKKTTYNTPTVPDDYPEQLESALRDDHNISERNAVTLGGLALSAGLILEAKWRKRRNNIKKNNL